MTKINDRMAKQGSTRINYKDRQRLQKVCRHEVGHYIAARTLLFKTDNISVTIYPDIGHKGEAGIEPWTPGVTSIADVETYLERRIKVLYCGVISEAMDNKGEYNSPYALNEWRQGGATNDYAKIRELTQVLRNIRHPQTQDTSVIQQELTTIDNRLIQQAGTLVYDHIVVIHDISNTLSQKAWNYCVEYQLTEIEINSISSVKVIFNIV